MNPGHLNVLVSGVRVGGLVSLPNGRVRFSPEVEWLDRQQRPPLGLSFLVDPSPRVGKRVLPAWFENLLPEPGSALRRWLCRHHGIRESNSLALLALLGSDLPGAVEVLGEAGDTEAPATDLPDTGQMRFSLAGMQLKLSMLRQGDRFVFPARNEDGSWIIKLPGEQFPELPEVEASTMNWAQACGLAVPDFSVVSSEQLDLGLEYKPRRAFAIKRFDRQPEGRIHQEDFAQALDLEPDEKYGDTPRGTSYDALAKLVRDACGRAGQDEFIKRLAFVVGSGNDDAHLKNWTFQWGHEHRPWLSPCYDLVTTIAWPEFGWSAASPPTLALGLGKTRQFCELKQEHLARFAARGSADEGPGIFEAALERMQQAWPSVADEAPPRMRAALAEHWERVPLLRRFGGLSRAN